VNLPYPFDKASGIQPNAQGSIRLIDDQGKALARIPMNTAFELSPEAEGYGHGGHGFGHGDGSIYGHGHGYGHGCGDGFGDGYGDDVGNGDGSGRSN
jgi:hypothetical protein